MGSVPDTVQGQGESEDTGTGVEKEAGPGKGVKHIGGEYCDHQAPVG